jgi:hypothetical protein
MKKSNIPILLITALPIAFTLNACDSGGGGGNGGSGLSYQEKMCIRNGLENVSKSIKNIANDCDVAESDVLTQIDGNVGTCNKNELNHNIPLWKIIEDCEANQVPIVPPPASSSSGKSSSSGNSGNSGNTCQRSKIGSLTISTCSQGPEISKAECESDGGTYGNKCSTTGIKLTCDFDEKVFFYSDMKGGNCDDPFKGFPARACEINYGVYGKVCFQTPVIDKSICDGMNEEFTGSSGHNFINGSCQKGGLECDGEMGFKLFLYGDMAGMGCGNL